MPLAKKTFKLAVLTSGADASGMNFALSSVVKYAAYPYNAMKWWR